MAFECHTIIVDFAGLRKRENLKTTRVGEHGTMPLHELVQATHVAYEFVAGAQVEMICVAQHERGIDVLKMFGCESLDCRLCANRREHRRKEVAMRCGEDSRPGTIVFGSDSKFEHRLEL